MGGRGSSGGSVVSSVLSAALGLRKDAFSNVRLAALRDKLGYSRARVDQALRQLDKQGKIMLHPEEDRRAITAADAAAAIQFGGEMMHTLTIAEG